MSDPNIALNRFGLGARPDEAPPTDARKWLTDQLTCFDATPPAIAALPGRAAIANDIADYLDQQRAVRQMKAAMPDQAPPPPIADAAAPGMSQQRMPNPARREMRQQGRETYLAAVGARANVALVTPTPFVERLVQFWANHFAISADKQTVTPLAGNFEFEAIRPHVLGSFGEMLGAVERHPAMLLYLDQAQSVGPNSAIGARVAARGQRKIGLNENLAREIMELHTLGVRTGYSQGDVTEFARAMTGWSVAGIGRGPGARLVDTGRAPGDFAFVPQLHEPGTRKIMGKSYAQGGEAQAQSVLNDLAVHPATATHVATKLARHFAGDTPPPAMVARLRDAFVASRGDLPTVYRALIASPEAWTPTGAKFRSPWDWSIATMRGLGYRTIPAQQVTGLLGQLGQPTWRPGSPAGYEDLTATWAGPDAVMRRVEAAERFATRTPNAPDARMLAPKLFPGSLSPATSQALSRAESPRQALALLLVSPEMMRR